MAAATILGIPSAAHADACSGVTVVVDSRGLGGGIQQSCDAGGGGKIAADIFTESDHSLTPVQQQPGAVCRVDGQPSDQQCVTMPPASRYWALYWSTGQSGTWIYSSLGVDSLRVPTGGAVAFSFSVNGATPPGVAPPVTSTVSSSAPAPSTAGVSATSKPTARPTRSSTKPRPTAAPTPVPLKPSAKVSAPSPSTSATPTSPTSPASPSSPASTASTSGAVTFTEAPSQSVSASPVPRPASASTDDHGGLPGWVPVGLIGVLLLAAGVIVAVRRRA